MSDDLQQTNGNGSAGPAAGERLAEARRSREISLHEIAKELHLDEPKVQALEQNRFDMLGAPVFAKGYLRKYAELVGIPVDEVIADYYRLNRSAGTPPLITSRPRPPREFSLGTWLAGIAVLVLVLLSIWWWLAVGSEWFAGRNATSSSGPVASDNLQLPGRDTRQALDPPARQTPQIQVIEDPPPAEAAEEEATPAAQHLPAAQPQPTTADRSAEPGDLQLRLIFSGDCWTEVTDADGRRLYFGLGSAGNEVSVSGEAPLRALLGNSNNVSVFVNGSSYPIPASARRGDTARLTLTAR
ncbi:MAG TPA: RodZ domain-containing protein [Woeseiaceae bacterium]|nr:RodZ domain-containing protein [Woeseiaceae bacterium]